MSSARLGRSSVISSATGMQVVYALATLVFSYYFVHLRYHTIDQLGSATLDDLLAGKAATPFQYRALVPWMASLWQSTQILIINSSSTLFASIEFLSTVLLLYAFRSYLRLFVRDARIATWVSLSICYVLPFNFVIPRPFVYLIPSDIPAILFFTLGLWALHERKWLPYYVLFAVGTFNRETICFLTVVHVLVASRGDNIRTMSIHVVSQLAIWVVIKVLLCQLYADNPGSGLFELHHVGRDRFHLLTNIACILFPTRLPFLLSTLGFLWIPVWIYRRRIKDEFVRRSIWVMPVFFSAMMLVGNVLELRIYGELIPVVLVPLLLLLRDSPNSS